MNWFVREFLIYALELVGAFSGYLSINFFKDKRYFWGSMFTIITIRIIAGVIKVSFM